MNEHYEKFKSKEEPRDYVYRHALSLFPKDQKLKILEIGTSRSLAFNNHSGDGTSTFFWCERLLECGGHLDICDVSQEAINNCKILISDFLDKISVTFHLRDGIELIDNSYDIILLDGSDDPVAMVDQFERIDREKTLTVCDDWNGPGGKGDLLKLKYLDFEMFPCGSIHQMAIYYPYEKILQFAHNPPII